MPWKKLESFNYGSKEDWLRIVRNEAGDKLDDSLEVVADRVIEIPEICCTNHIGKTEGFEDFARKWTNRFINGFENRPSKRTSNPIGTQHDPILDEIISARTPISTEDLESIKYGHRLSMSAENIAGSLLEEYVASKLLKYKWHCCWGETMKSIDFCHEDGQLLQIKNSDNSENSSSKTVRDGTKIKHWFRRFSKTGKTNWESLNTLVNIQDENDLLTEESYREFVRKAVSNNPGSVFLEDESPYGRNHENNES
ncbi:SinI family restriction endonuclease [uncultured Marivirga sp.]|uniref:SinI family restriction endonuclease n=1 Tax=uncultured Marivirga sp. TaxID=1123707 RepID=UPI0030EB8FD3